MLDTVVVTGTTWTGSSIELESPELAAERVGGGGVRREVDDAAQGDLDGLRRRLGVDDFQVDRAGFGVFGRAVVERRVGHGSLEDGVAVILAEHLDGMVAGGAVGVEGVIADQVGAPLARAGVDVDK